MPNLKEGTASYTFAQAIAQGLASALSEGTSGRWKCEVSSQAGTPSAEERVVYKLALSGSLDGIAYLQLRSTDVSAIEKKLSAADSAESNDIPGKLFEVLVNRATDAVARSLVATLGEVQFTDSLSTGAELPQDAIVLITSEPGSSGMVIELFLDSKCLSSLDAASTTPVGKSVAKQASNTNLGLIMGVELDVTLRFGQRTLTLGEIMNLNAGSVVELDRQVQEPVELLLQDRVIAHGEVVIVEGNYGLRITDVVDAETRIGAI